MNIRKLLLAATLVFLLAACAAPNNNTGEVPTPQVTGETGVPGLPGEPGVPDTGVTGTCPEGITAEELFNQGETTYATNCAQCHGQQGEGVQDFPALVEDPLTTGQDIPALIRAYYEIDLHPQLADQELAAVFTYARNAWGNQADIVCPQQVSDAALEPQQ